MTARFAALSALERSRHGGAWSAQILDRYIQEKLNDRREAALAARLFLGVLQNSAYLDYYIDHFCTANKGKLEPKLRDILRLGSYQLLFSDKIPAHAAVSESVALCKDAGLGRASGLVNAVLRRIAENREHLPEIPGTGSAEYLSIRYSHPVWIVERILRQYGYDHAEAFLRANNAQAEISIRINTLQTDRESVINRFLDSGVLCDKPDWPEDCLLISGGHVSELPGFSEGDFYVQDRAAAMAVEIADPQPGWHVLDACAAPGGKSFAAAIRMRDQGVVIACDIHEKKPSLIREGAERMGLHSIRTQTKDARALKDEWREAFDLVIADVPCSGLGVIRKKPEIRYKKEAEISSLPEIQSDVLDRQSDFVRPGGTLLYSTCTVLKEENEDVIHSFLKRHRDFSLEPFSVGNKCTEGFYTFWPHVDGTDGFFVARMKRATL